MSKTEIQKKQGGGKVGFLDEMPKKNQIPQPPVQIRSLIVWMLIAGLVLFGGIGTWAAFAPIQSAVVASGSFKVDGNLQVLQHLEGGIVSKIGVREGDKVKAGQVVAELDDTRARAQMGILSNQLCGALAREARLKAEYTQADTITYSEELLDILVQYPLFEDVLLAQTEMFTSNRTNDQGRIAILTDRIDQLTEQLVGIRGRHNAQNEQLEIVKEEVRDLRQLLEKGLTVKSRYFARRQREAALVGEIGQSESEMQSVYQQIAEIKERMLQVRRDRQLTIADDLQVLKEQIFDVRQRLSATRDIARRLTIRAPISGRIVGFDLNTVGAVIQPGQSLLKIVPEDSTFIVEAQVQPSDIDEIVMGGRARVRLTSYSFRTTPPVEGTVSYVSADTFSDSSTDGNYYLVRIRIPDRELAELPNVQAILSMPVQVMIATGEQTVITYLLNPILGGIETAMVEGE